MEILINGEKKQCRMLHLSYEDISRMAFGEIIPGMTCTYSVPGQLGGSLRPGERTVAQIGMSIAIYNNLND